MLKKLKAASVKAAASKLDTSPGGLKKNAMLQYNTGMYRDAIETFNKVLSHPSICSVAKNGEASSKSVSVGSANGAVDGNLFRMLGLFLLRASTSFSFFRLNCVELLIYAQAAVFLPVL